MKQIKNNNYITIQGWMINELNLSGNDLIVYAIIYGFSQDEESSFKGSREYLSNWCNSTIRGIQKNLNNLLEKNLIIKEETELGKICRYKCNPDFISKK